MKIIKKADGKSQIKIKKAELENIGKEHGWKEPSNNGILKVAQSINKDLNNIPHVLLVQGPSGIGKPFIANKIADVAELPLQTIEIGGENSVSSEIEARSIVNKLFSSSETVYVVSGVDKLITMGGKVQEYAKPIVEWLFNCLESGIGRLTNNNVYVVLTSSIDLGIDHSIPLVSL